MNDNIQNKIDGGETAGKKAKLKKILYPLLFAVVIIGCCTGCLLYTSLTPPPILTLFHGLFNTKHDFFAVDAPLLGITAHPSKEDGISHYLGLNLICIGLQKPCNPVIRCV